MSRICKKCLVGQQAEDYLLLIGKAKVAIPSRDRTEEGEYDKRIALCEACDKLSGPTCLGCGCYVELRAARRSVHCPYKKW